MRIESREDLAQFFARRTNGHRVRITFREGALVEVARLQSMIRSGQFGVDNATLVRLVNVLVHKSWTGYPDRSVVVRPLWPNCRSVIESIVVMELGDGVEEAEFVQ